MADTVRIEIPIEAQDQTNPGVQNAQKNLDNLAKSANNLNNSVGKASGQISKFDQHVSKTSKTLQSWMREKWELLLEAKDKVSPTVGTIKGGLSTIFSRSWSVTLKAIDLVTSPVRGIMNLLRNPVIQAGAVLGVSVSLTDTINTYKDFESAMSQVSAVSGATGSALEKLTDKARQMGATTKFTATEAAEGFNYMAMAGWKTEDMLNGIDGIMALAAASGEDLGTTSDIVTDALTAFGLQASDAGHFSDVLAAASSNANTNVSLMGETFKYAASMAGTLGYSIEDVALMTGLMANSGIKASMAGTALNTIFTRLSTDQNGARSAIEALGISFFDSTGTARDLGDVMGELRDATEGYTDQQKTALAKTIAGSNAQKGLLAILNASTKDYDALAEAINNADGASERMSDTMLDNLQGSLTLLQSAVDGVKISFGGKLAPYVREFADWLTDLTPDVENGLDEFMKYFDTKADEFKGKLTEITGTDEFKNADIFGKVDILWDNIIIDPFKEWWSETGKQFFADIAKDAGSGIGTGIKVGILTLLGIDVSDALDDGVSIGKSFSQGLAEGIDMSSISGALADGFGNMLSSAGKLIPGGKSADIGSIISAAILAKMALPLVSMGKGTATLGKQIFGAPAGGGTSLASSVVGSSAAGTGILGMGANAAIGLGAGNLAGGASLGTGALSALGLGAIAGGVMGGVSSISGGLDIYNASKSDSSAEAAALNKSGAFKIGGVAAGAATGAAIGSVIPVVGTAAGALIGAGVGGIGGMIAGNRTKKDYEEQAKAAAEQAELQSQIAEKAYAATGQAVDDLTFRNKELTKALNDTSVSSREFAQMFNKAVSDDIVSRFGKISLSAQEIKSLAGSIVFGDKADTMEKFEDAMTSAEKHMTNISAEIKAIDKLNWKNGLGFGLSSDEISGYQSSVESMIDEVSDYVDSKHYEGALAKRLLYGDDVNMDDLDSAYESISGQLETLGAELSEKTKIYLQDGVLTLDEQAELENLQSQISDITSKLTDAQNDASFDALKIKFGGAGMDYDSFKELQEQLKSNIEEMTSSYDDALEIDLTNIRLEYSQGAIDDDELQEKIEEAKEAYQSKIQEMNLKVEGFQMDTIAEAFGNSLDGILPELEGTTAEKLQTALNNALAEKPDASAWSVADMIKWFDLDGLDTELQTEIATMMQSVAETIPPEVFKAGSEAAATSLGTSLGTAFDTMDMSTINTAIADLRTRTGDRVNTTFSSPLSTTVGVNVTLKPTILNQGSISDAVASSGSGSYTNVQEKFKHHANGGFTNGAELSWIGEDGPEAIIPLGSKRRQRGLDLYKEVGDILGVDANADGGIYDGIPVDTGNASVTATSGSGDVSVNVTLNPTFEISGAGQSEDDIVSVLRRHIREMADEMGGEIAERLIKVYENMPMAGGV